MGDTLRLAYLSLEATFKRLYDDGFSGEKAIVVIACSQIAAIFCVVNFLVLNGLNRSGLRLGYGVALSLAFLMVFIDYKIIKWSPKLEVCRRAYGQISASNRFLIGAAIHILAAAIVVTCIVTAGMVAKLKG